MRGWLRLLAVIAALSPLLLLTAALADGSLPPLPYRYLHPPPALAKGNKPPAPALRVLPADYLRSVQAISLFTPDTQAGISGGKGVFGIDRGTKAVTLRITPVNVPPGLPQTVAPDGNAYTFQAIEQPSGKAARLVKPILLTLRFPHIPIAIYTYRSGTWKQLCYEDAATLTAATIACRTRRLGLFLQVTPPSNAVVPSNPSTPWQQLDRYIPLIAAVLLVLVAAVLGYYVTRPDPQSGGGRKP